MARAKFVVVGKLPFPKSWDIATADPRTRARWHSMDLAVGKRSRSREYSFGPGAWLRSYWAAATERDAKRMVAALRRIKAHALYRAIGY